MVQNLMLNINVHVMGSSWCDMLYFLEYDLRRWIEARNQVENETQGALAEYMS